MNARLNNLLKNADCRRVEKTEVRDEFIQLLLPAIRLNFTSKGKYLPKNPGPHITREYLYNCDALFRSSKASDQKLANAIIQATPCDNNRFLPLAATDLLLGHADKLTTQSREHLLKIVERHIVNMIDTRFGGPGVNNFSAMTTYGLLAAAQLLESGYNWSHPLGGAREMYTRGRLHQIGMNALYALAYCAEHEPAIREWNSSCYAPYTLHALANIVERIGDEEARRIALNIESRIWMETLSSWHPELDVLCGPYSRAYMADRFQLGCGINTLMTYVGLSRVKSLRKRLMKPGDNTAPRNITAEGNVDSRGVVESAWIINCAYHIPRKAIAELRTRKYPHRVRHAIRWEPFGVISKTAKPSADHVPGIMPKNFYAAQGEVFRGGTGAVCREIHPLWAIGYRSAYTIPLNSFPLHFHYARKKRPDPLTDINTLLAGVFFCGTAKPSFTHFTQEGAVDIKGSGKIYNFTGSIYPEMQVFPIKEISINSFLHLGRGMPDKVWLNGNAFGGDILECRDKKASLCITDGGVEYELTYQFSKPVPVRLWIWNGLLRFGAIFKECKEHYPKPCELELPKWEGCLCIRKVLEP